MLNKDFKEFIELLNAHEVDHRIWLMLKALDSPDIRLCSRLKKIDLFGFTNRCNR